MREPPAVAERIAQALRRHEVELIFGQSVPTAILLAAEAAGIRQITYRQENMGGAMADGYARASGRVAVIAAQNGPAAALLVAPLAEALKASIPIVALVQDVETGAHGRNASQELEHESLFRACTKWVRTLTSADRVDDHMDAAFRAAASGRPGPAVLLVPSDLASEPAAPSVPRRQSFGRWPLDRVRPDTRTIEAAADAIAAAKLAVVMAGGGAVSPAAREALARLQERASLPVFTTTMGKGAVAETHPLACGVLASLTGPGSLGYRTRALLREADLVLLVGTRTNEDGTDGWTSIPAHARVIQIDLDPEEVGRNYDVLRMVGEASATLRALDEALARRDLSRRRSLRAELELRIAAAWRLYEADRSHYAESDASPLRPERILRELQAQLRPGAIVVGDASYASSWVTGQLRATAGGMRFLTPRGLAGLGWGFPLAIGAKLACPEQLVVAVVGDGAFAHAWAELETVARYGIPLAVIVLNNRVLAQQKDAEAVKFGRYTSACYLSSVDHAAIARACGCEAARVERADQLGPALDQALGSSSAWLLDVLTDPGAHPGLSLFAGKLDRETSSGVSQEAVL